MLIELGLAADSAGRAERARQAFEQALRLDPDHPEATARLGERVTGPGR